MHKLAILRFDNESIVRMTVLAQKRVPRIAQRPLAFELEVSLPFENVSDSFLKKGLNNWTRSSFTCFLTLTVPIA